LIKPPNHGTGAAGAFPAVNSIWRGGMMGEENNSNLSKDQKEDVVQSEKPERIPKKNFFHRNSSAIQAIGRY